MARSTAYRNSATDAVAVNGAGDWIAAHTANPSGGAGNEVTGGGYARQQAVWPAASNGSSQVQVVFDIPAGTTVTHWSRQGASSGDSNYEDGALSANAVFNSAGTLTLTITVSTPA
jgi:hypothetical protein